MAFFVFLISAASLSAQNLGELAGFVRDSSGAIVAGAEVTAVEENTNQKRSTTTSAFGGYTIPLLPPGVYRVTAQAPGLQPCAVRAIKLGVDARARADFTLQPGPVEEAVEVVAPAPLLRRENASLTTVIGEELLRDFPLNGRNYLSLVKIGSNVSAEMPGGGARESRLGGERAEQAIAIAGQRQEANRFTLDGIENTDVNFNSYLVRPSLDALREVKVETGVYSAQYGRTMSQIIVGTKSGTNELHGTLFEFHRNENLDAKRWRREGDKNPFVRNQFGFTVGGPLMRNRLFFFSNMELLRDRRTFQEDANVATDAMRVGDFSGQRGIFDPLTRSFEGGPGDEFAVAAEPFPNQVIPESRHNRVALALFEFYPAPTRATAEVFDNYRRDSTSSQDTEQYLQRFDWRESDASGWFGRFSHGNERRADPRGPFPHQAGRVETRAYQWAVSNTRSFSPRALNELRIGYNRFRNDKVGWFAFERDVLSELGAIGLVAQHPSTWGVPQVTFGDGLSTLGEPIDGPWVNRNQMVQLLDNVSLVTGGHSVKFGGEFRRDHYNHLSRQVGRGQFDFQGVATADPANRGSTGHSFADYMLGAATQSTRAPGVADARLRATSWAFYMQDTWRAARWLTIDLGLRYEYTPPYYDARRGIINAQVFDMGVGPGGLLRDTRTPIMTRPGDGDFYEGIGFRYADGIPTQTGDAPMGRRLVNSDRNDFAPRLGIAFSPTRRWTVRAGGGLFYSQDIGNARFDLARNLGGRDRHQSNQERPDSYLDDPWAFSRQNFVCSDWDGVCLGQLFTFANGFRRRTPYVMQWMFDLQRQLTDSIVLGARYQGSGGRRLERLRPFNQAVQRSGLDDRSSLLSRRPWPAYGTLQQLDGIVNSSYHAVSLKAQSRLSRGVTFLVNYTWSKAIDTGSAIRTASGERLFPADNYDLRLERGLSQFDVRHRFVGSFLYDLPFGPGRAWLSGDGWASTLLGGWRFGGILTLAGGSPATVASIGDRNDTGVGNYPDATGVSPMLDEPTPERLWNVEAFDTTNPELEVRSGNVGRSTLRNPGYANWDVSLLKDFPIGEDQRLQLRLEAFNAANHPNWFPPGRNARSPANFSRVFGARTMRELQLGVKYLF